MPFPMKIQPIDCNTPDESFRNDSVKPVVKSRFKRLFERQFSSVLKISSSEKSGVCEQNLNKDGISDFEPSSVCLDKMVQNFIEESNEKQTKCGSNCFNGNSNDSSDDELDFFGGFSDTICTTTCGEAGDFLKNLVDCTNITERNILADISKIIEMNKIYKSKDDSRKIVTEVLINLGYDVSICKSRWGKASSYPAGDYEYIDAIVEGDRLIIDIEFRSEFEIARSTKNYRAILQSLPSIFVGKPDRLQQIVSIVSEAAKQSLKKKGMHLPPWRKAEYIRAKWLSSFTRISTLPSPSTTPPATKVIESQTNESEFSSVKSCSVGKTDFSGEFDLIFGGKSSLNSPIESISGDDEEKIKIVVSPWQPPAIKPKSFQRGGKIVTGLASILK